MNNDMGKQSAKAYFDGIAAKRHVPGLVIQRCDAAHSAQSCRWGLCVASFDTQR